MVSQKKVIGRNTFHPNLMIWSYLYLGRVALSQRNIKTNMSVLKESQINPGINDKYGSNIVPWNGDNHPPKNMILHKILINIKFMYSAKKNMANAIPEYST